MTTTKEVNSSTKIKREKVLLKDEVVKRIFTSGTEASKEYLLSIISAIIEVPLERLKEDFEFIEPNISVNKNVINNEADLVFKSNETYFTFEFNYSPYKELANKNFSYMCQLYLRQIKHKEDYKNIKKIWQFCINNFDYFDEGRFVYISEMLERKSHKKRDIGMYIVDINLPYLEKIEYNEIKKGHILEKLLYIFICDNKEILEKVYEGDRLMEEVKKEVDSLVDDFDSLLYYDKKALDKRTLEWESKQEGKREIIRNMLREGYDIKSISKVSGFSEYQVNEIKYDIEHFNNWD